MSHVDDGTLHAYLDGALDAAETAGLEAHLAGCAACRARLDEERALIARAGELLALAAPPPPHRAAPPLHELRHPRLWWRVRTPLAWAATLVLALAAGWYLRGEGGNLAPVATRQLKGAVAKSQTSATVAQNRAAGREVDQLEAPTAEARVPSPSAGLVAAEDRVEAKIVSRDEAATGPIIMLADARAILGAEPVALPEVPIRRLWKSGGGIVLEQALDSVTVIQLIERPAAPQAEAAPVRMERRARADLASTRLARYVGSLRVEIAGPLPVDSLSKLLERLKPIPR